MIPKIIHYCWFGGKKLPGDVKKCIASWKKFCPDYEIRQWNEENFDVNAHPFTAEAAAAGAWAFVSDYARLKIVYDCGGIYLDTDVELLKPLDGLLEDACFVGVQQVGHFVATGLGFGGARGSGAVKAMLDEYASARYDTENREACPYLNTRALLPFGFAFSEEVQRLPGLTVYPCRYFDPLSPGDTENLLCGDTVSIHHYSASWMSPQTRFKRRLIRLVGEERVTKIRGMLKK